MRHRSCHGVFLGLPVAGHMHPGLGLVRELVHRGHRMTVYATPPWRERVEAVGATFAPYDDPAMTSLDPPDNTLVLLALMLHAAERVLPGLIREVEHAPPADRPEFLVVDSAASWGAILARRMAIPAVTSCTTFAIDERVARAINGDMRRFLGTLLGGAGAVVDALRTGRRLRLRYGVEAPRFEEIVAAPTDARIVYTARSLQPFADRFGEDTHFVGPALTARHESWEDPLPDGFLYVSLGTLYNARPAFFRQVVEGFRDSDVPVLLNVGARLDRGHLGRVPPHIRVVQHAPQLAVLERAGAFVTHGGMNSVHESLLAGVPMVVTPQGADQFLVADRIEALGAGLELLPRDVTATALRASVDRVRSEPSFQATCQKLGDDLRSAGGAPAAADVVEALLQPVTAHAATA